VEVCSPWIAACAAMTEGRVQLCGWQRWLMDSGRDEDVTPGFWAPSLTREGWGGFLLRRRQAV